MNTKTYLKWESITANSICFLSAALLWYGGSPQYNRLYRTLGSAEGLLFISAMSFSIGILALKQKIQKDKIAKSIWPVIGFVISTIPLILFLLWICFIILVFLTTKMVDGF